MALCAVEIGATLGNRSARRITARAVGGMGVTMRHLLRAVGFSAGLLAVVIYSGVASADMLISEAEAKLPPSPDAGLTMRGLTRGPGIEQISPDPDRGASAPLALKVKFLTRNNVAIDPASVKITYLKASPVDLTDRIKPHLTADGINMSSADVPPGTHVMRIELKDAQGRASTAVLKLMVAPK
jgi:hypothetical protein